MYRSIIVIHCCVYFRKKLKDDIEKKKGYIFLIARQLNFIRLVCFTFEIFPIYISKNHIFVGRVLTKWKTPLKIRKQMVQIQVRYFHLAFKRIFFDVPLLRSSRHKSRNFYADVEKERKKVNSRRTT